ncbi:isoamylase early set domain-containing protein [Mesohalobacter halotolerans]|jgi:1,4-alpha-glucan branching enzyme|uniref:Glycoside hydrolase n=1 Tax=Mesohalobacter halotolerans TaxID=1883405 RepID=A0A4U5TSE0_9FLAO|nr:isoamylase early set domain-containing protein [Mesohalobacter halotolerans]MBS3737454.1 isoamylase early set domain-containing protein [Psychroflexus sp.]NBC58008.1 glycoside hydrolase [Bacteroidota bacterium]TKS57036.1 glycoside hydrolase [Mesohalobacter halotolerans]
MAIKKQFLKTKPVCKVTFTIEAKDAEKAFVCGNFNNWNQTEHELKKLKNGNFKTTIDLEKDNTFEFKYIIDNNWANEEQADSYKWNGLGSENSVLEV